MTREEAHKLVDAALHGPDAYARQQNGIRVHLHRGVYLLSEHPAESPKWRENAVNALVKSGVKADPPTTGPEPERRTYTDADVADDGAKGSR